MKKLASKILIASLAAAQIAVAVSAKTTVLDLTDSDEWYYHGVFYGRGIQLQTDEAGENKGNIYVTSEYYYYPGRYGQEHFPIFESRDGGESFTQISSLYETEHNTQKYIKDENGNYIEAEAMVEGATRLYNEWWGLIYQPVLFELTEQIGDLKKGTVICGGMAKSSNYSSIEVHYSTDGLKTWTYLSTLALGGQGTMNTASAVWEPYFVIENGALYCFYSDERGMQGGGQRLVYSKSTDGINWSDAVKVCDFEEENPAFRPGMPIVTRLKNGKYMLVYEGVNMGSGYLPTFYKLTDDIEEWNYTDHGTAMPAPIDGGSPYCTTMPDGTIVVGSHNTSKIALNNNNLEADKWTLIDTSITNAYSRSLFPLMNGDILVTSGGNYNEDNPRTLECSVEKVPTLSKIKVSAASVTGSEPWGETEPNWGNSYTKVVDGSSETFFDTNKEGYVILDLGSEIQIDGIGFMPRRYFASRMNGGIFYGSSDGENWTALYTIPRAPSENYINYVDKSEMSNVEDASYRYIKYTTNGIEHCSVAEIEIYSRDALTISVDGKLLDFGMIPYEEDGEYLIPLRLVCEELGAKVSWIDETKEAVAEFENAEIRVKPGESKGVVLDNGTVYVKLGIITDAVGCTAWLNSEHMRLYITR